MEVEAKFGGGTKWFKGKITRARSDGTFDIQYEDGDTEKRVKRELVRAVGGSEKKKKKKRKKGGGSGDSSGSDSEHDAKQDSGSDGSASSGSPSDLSPRPGARVKAQRRGDKSWLHGKITRVRSDGSCDIKFDDGETERRVRRKRIRLQRQSSSNSSRSDDDTGTDDSSEPDEDEARVVRSLQSSHPLDWTRCKGGIAA